MKPVTYTCERFPGFSLGSTKEREIKFRRGAFVATEKWQVEMLEGHEWFDVFIFKPGGGSVIEPVPPDVHPVQKPVRTGIAPAAEGALVPVELVEPIQPPDPVEPVQPVVPPEPAEPPKLDLKVSKTAAGLLEKAEISIPEAAAKLGLADGDRLTVKMAEELIDG